MRILAIGAHPDDIEIACSGTLAKCVKRGDTVIVCHASSGNLGHVIIPPDELTKIRAEEARRAGAMAGIEVIWGGFAYYQKTMYMTVAINPGSREALNTIKSSLVYDIALLYDWGGYTDVLLDIGTAASNQYAQRTANIETANAQMEITLEQFKNPQYVPDAQ